MNMPQLFSFTNRFLPALAACLILFAGLPAFAASSDNVETLALGATAPDFHLEGTDNKFYTLKDFADAELLLVIFTCNHCPTAQAYEDRMIALTDTYGPKGVAVVAISPNDPSAVRLDELGYTDLNDTLEDMQLRAEHKQFNFPYLYDGDIQDVTRAYGPVATPHAFLFDKDRKLVYVGRIDDNEKIGAATIHDTKNALDAMLAGKPVPVAKTKTFGCSIKWADKGEGVRRAQERWEKEPVSVTAVDAAAVKEILKNDTDNYRLVNMWAMWCGPCVTEFPEFVDMHLMYRRRNFEMVTISMDDAEAKEDVIKFLKSEHASMTNYHYTEEDAYALIDAVDEEWPGALPYTVLVAPGGEIVFRMLGEIDPLEIRKTVVDHIGRYYD
ncbi:MAG: redoxin domain-containing protein [Bacteroidota bacterium]